MSTDNKAKDRQWVRFIAGALGSSTAEICTLPIDCTKGKVVHCPVSQNDAYLLMSILRTKSYFLIDILQFVFRYVSPILGKLGSQLRACMITSSLKE